MKEGEDDGERLLPESGKKGGAGGEEHQHPVEDFGSEDPSAHPTTASLPKAVNSESEKKLVCVSV